MFSSHPLHNPIRVAYDISRMSPGGANGGIKTHHYAFLESFCRHFPHELSLVVFCSAALIPELDFLADGPANEIHVLGPKDPDIDYRNLNRQGKMPPLRFWPERPERLLSKLMVDLLYCGFGYSELHEASIPQISLIVDCLHKDLPEYLPRPEVDFREAWMGQAIAQSALVQTNSRFCCERLQSHYGIPSEKLFPVALPLHARFNEVESGTCPDTLAHQKFFFYPANHWPHKNHETLLVAYQNYVQRCGIGTSPWDLALTGPESPRRRELQALCETLGIAQRVRFLDHLSLADFKQTWEECSALVFPSLYEGFGVPLLEAMHFQKPIIAGREASIPEVAGEEPVHWCDVRQPLQIADKMLELTRGGLTRQAYGPQLGKYGLHTESHKIVQACRMLTGREHCFQPLDAALA